jgi:[protein-PII] uridylyltransferase
VLFRGFIDGRPDFDEYPDTETVIPADIVIFAIGQRPETDCLKQASRLRGGRVQVDPETLSTDVPGVFAGGDAVTGTTFIVDAIAAGHKAARSIAAYLEQVQPAAQPSHPVAKLAPEEVTWRIATRQVSDTPRTFFAKQPAELRKVNFSEMYAGLSVEQAREEASRCLRCGICSECNQCVYACRAGAIVHTESERLEEINAAAAWFMAARNWLHIVAGKHSDVLLNNYQDRIASELRGQPAQQWLAEHYRHAEVLASFRDSAVRAALAGPVRLDGILLDQGCLQLDRGARQRRPGSVIRLLQLSQRYGVPVSLEDMKELQDAREEALRVDHASAEDSWAFLSILGGGRRVTATIRTIAQLGLMDRFIPGFSGLMRFVPPDPAHRYTVGEHSIRIVDHLEMLRDERNPADQRFSELLSGCEHFDMLCLAALLHDAGKLIPGHDHSEAGIALALDAAARLSLPPEKQEILEILVRHHLLLVRTARLQDLKSPAVIQQVAEKCRTIDVLRHLYVFTYVDTRAVAERNWTSMDYRDLEDLYRKVQELLQGQGQEPPSAASIESRIVQIRRRLGSGDRPVDEEAIRLHCESLPASYVLNTPLEEIEFHLELLQRLEAEGIVVDIYNRPGEDYSELTVCTYDDPRPGMLARITGVLYGCNVGIHRAQVYTMKRDRPIVLDTLSVRSGAYPISEKRARRIRAALKDVLGGAATVDRFLESVGKRPPDAVPVEGLELRNDLSEEHTVVHVIARDLQGLLYLMTRALSRNGLHIHSAKVATWNARAENNFYVTALTGGQIPDAELGKWRGQILKSLTGEG